MVSIEQLDALVEEWRTRSANLRLMGLSQPAAQMEAMAAQLEARISEWLEERLTLDQAAQESGYTYNHLQACVAEGRLPNAGRPGEPRISRRHLPAKVGHRGTPSIADMVTMGSGKW